MNPTDPLAQLHPLRDPALVGWWPPAPGWWILLALCLAAGVASAWWLYRRWRRNAYRRLGLRQLELIVERYHADRDLARGVQDINALLKGVALRAYPRRDVAAISGDDWRAFLARSAPEGPPFATEALTAQYRPGTGDTDLEALALAARHWIRRHEAAR